jgi:hypothetical protein
MRGGLLATATVAFALVAGCGSDRAAAPQPSTAKGAGAPALASAPRGAGEIVVRGDASPLAAGPFRFRGEYRVRFEQYAPEDASLDFGAQTPFVLELTRGRDEPRRLFSAATARGARRIRIDGRMRVDVSFGDFPFVVRFTPVRG